MKKKKNVNTKFLPNFSTWTKTIHQLNVYTIVIVISSSFKQLNKHVCLLVQSSVEIKKLTISVIRKQFFSPIRYTLFLKEILVICNSCAISHCIWSKHNLFQFITFNLIKKRNVLPPV